MANRKSNKVVVNTIDRALSFAPETENEAFGRFILQTNQVQVTLAIAVLLESSLRDKKYNEFLFGRAELGVLITMFQACAEKTTETHNLLLTLRNYNKNRQKIAHKMYLSERRLNQKEARKAIKIGENILKSLDSIIKKHKGLN